MAAASVREAGAARATDRRLTDLLAKFDAAMSDDLNTAVALTLIEEAAAMKQVAAGQKRAAIATMDAVLGLQLLTLSRDDLSIRPKPATIAAAVIDAAPTPRRKAASPGEVAPNHCITGDK